jgi:O-antigen/teichoic acid export membrane protein
MGLAMLAITALETFSETGFNAALIQKKDNAEAYLDTAWTVAAVRGILLFVSILILAPVVSAFFNSPNSLMIIRAIAILTLLSGFNNVSILLFQKQLNFRAIFSYEFFSGVVDLIVSITLAVILKSVWALVWGGIAGQLVKLIMSYLLHPYRPKIFLQKEKFLELFGFGKWVFISSIVILLSTKGDDIIVGKILGIAALGLYQMAYTISNLPATEISQMISRVTFPAYSKIQDEMSTIRVAYLRVLKLTAFISIPTVGCIFILAPEFTFLFLGSNWVSAVPAMKILALSGLIRALISTMSPVFGSIKRPEINTKCQIVRLAFLTVTIYPLANGWGIQGAAYSALVSSLAASVLYSYYLKNVVKITLKNLLSNLLIPSMNTMLTIAFIFFLKTQIQIVTPWQFVLCVLIATATYIFLAGMLFDRYLNYGMYRLIKEL